MEETKNNQEEVDPMFSQIEGELKTRFELLPTDLQKVITSSDYQMQLFEIAKKHKLTYEKLGQLELETTMVLLGMTPPDEYKHDIGEQLALKGEALDELVKEINTQVFAPIREKLMGLYTKEEVELGEKFATESSGAQNQTTAQPASPLGINRGAVPTSETNQANSQKENTQNPPAPRTADPYRELPETGGTPVAPVPTMTGGISLAENASKHLSSLDSQKPIFTPKPVEPKPLAPLKNQSETLKGIANLKSALLGDIQSIQKETSKEQEVVSPIVKKEEIIVEPLKVEPLAQPVMQAVTPPTPEPAMTPVNPIQDIPTLGVTVPKITETTISLNNVSQELPGEKKAEMQQSTEADTSELMRNIKLQLDESKMTADQANRNETMQKIDAMIDFKKAGTFMPKKEEEVTQQMSTMPTPQKFTGSILDKDTQTGQIFEKDLRPLGGTVKKTGFFGKLKNFFGGAEPVTEAPQNPNITTMMPKAPAPIPQAPTPAQQAPMPTPPTQAQTQQIPVGHMPQAPVLDHEVDNVKIFDEVSVPKQ